MPYSFVGDAANRNVGSEKSSSCEEGDPALTASGVMRDYPTVGSAEVAEERRRQIMDGELDPKLIR